ncbi:ATP-dependent DNA helicase RecG [Candidatus Shapirobacteria bacterium]|nr:ATP-dependent DNA helicase RecG [Candidatus Shapirobacteria bacterium]
MSLTLADPVKKLPKINKSYLPKLKKLGIKTVEDLLYHFPSRHIDFSLVSKINQAQAGEILTIRGQIAKVTSEPKGRGKSIQRATIIDETGQINAVWFNQPYLVKSLSGKTISLSGEVKQFNNRLILSSPDFEVSSPYRKNIHTGRLVPVYPSTAGLSSRWLRWQINNALKLAADQIKEFLPPSLLLAQGFLNQQEAIRKIHFPENRIALEKARERLSFDELFCFQLAGFWRKARWQKERKAFPFQPHPKKVKAFLKTLPFSLTDAQKKAIKIILEDLSKNKPANRLLQGDVGSGKTIVAATASYVAFLNKRKTIFMAPTEILAQQHYQTLKKLLPQLKIGLLSSTSKKNTNRADILVGTHALLFKKKLPENVGLLVIDEQHRFGVAQRSTLLEKGSQENLFPHLLTLSATPIPRTIALTFLGDLDLTYLDQMPPGRKPVKTWLIPAEKRSAAYAWAEKEIKENNQQALVICPLVEESEKEPLKNIKAATAEYEKLKDVFPSLRLALLHGRTKNQEKEKILKQFARGKIDILVTTPIVEVGIDIPGANLIIIEAADRFGLAQLHQLRGRVGRREKQAYCLLFASPQASQKSLKRLKLFGQTYSGLKLAQIDLEERGPGEIYGTAQHGFPQTKIASLTNAKLIEKAQKMVNDFGPKFLKSPEKFSLLKKKLKDYTIEPVEAN